MKNILPLVAAVVLGLLAVAAVSRSLARNQSGQGMQEVEVLVANGNLKAGGVLSSQHFRAKRIPFPYAPKQHIRAEQSAYLVGQTLSRDISQDDYLQWSDIGRSTSLGESVGEGEWAVTITFANTAMAKLLSAGDEIAVVGVFKTKRELENTSADANAAKRYEERTVTTVIFPQVRIMSMAGSATALFSLPPEQALAAIAAQKEAQEIYAVLRRPHDDKAVNRKETGAFYNDAFAKMLNGCKDVYVPDQPESKVK